VTYDEARARIGERFGGAQVVAGPPLAVTVQSHEWTAFAEFAKNTLGFRMFSFLTAVDWKEQGLELIVMVDNLENALSLVMRLRLEPGVSACPSLTGVYRGADWMERECFDMFGIRFEGHPDLRRILLSDNWDGHPLLKSYAVDTPHPPYR
jgi:NADH-quinone oxidoreductase subunit C